MESESNIIEGSFGYNPKPIDIERLVQYKDVFSQFNAEIRLIESHTITLAQIALLSQYEFRRKGAKAKISELYDTPVYLRRLTIEQGLHAILDVPEADAHIYLATFSTSLNHEDKPKEGEEAIWRAYYER